MKLLLRAIWKYYKPYKFKSIFYIIGIFIDMAVASFIALSFKLLLDSAIGEKNLDAMLIIIIALAVSTILSKLFYLIRSYIYAKVVTGITKNLRIQIFKALYKKNLNYLREAKTGDILSHFSGDISSIEDLTYMAIPLGFSAVIGIIINFVIIFALEWKLAFIALLGVIICALGPYAVSKKAAILNDLDKEEQSNLLSEVEENIASQQLIRGFSLEDSMQSSYEKNSDRYAKISSKSVFTNDLMEIIPNITIDIINVLIICAGALMAYYSYITPGTLVSFNGLFLGLSGAVANLTWVLPIFMESSSSIKRIDGFINSDIEATEEKSINIDETIVFNDYIKLENISFGYDESKYTIKEMNLAISRGSRIAIIGDSGSGKTTVINLLTGKYKPSSGEIKIDGIAVKDNILRKITTVVFQESTLFNTTIMKNFQRIKPDVAIDEVIDATKRAQVHDLIENMANSYDTHVGERGRLLSSGVRQRLALALAFLYKPLILVLDEATASLDPQTERLINDALSSEKKDLTIVNATHRLDNIRNYDLIYVLDNGNIVECGTHEELKNINGKYAKLIEKQSGFIISDDYNYVKIEVDRLKTIPIFESLDTNILLELKEFFVSEYYQQGNNIINFGDQGEKFYVIVRGKVEVLIANNEGNERVVKVLEDGDYFGEIALLKRVSRTATVRAKTPCTVLSLKREQFEKIISNDDTVRELMQREMELRLTELKS